jgi:hypothetical protein
MVKQFFQVNGLRIVAIGVIALASVAFYLYSALQLSEARRESLDAQLRTANATIQAQERAIAAVDRVNALEDRLDEIVSDSMREILDAEGADQQVPPDVAATWAAGFDSLRDAGNSDPGDAKRMRHADEAKRRELDCRTASDVFARAGSCITSVQPKAKRSD